MALAVVAAIGISYELGHLRFTTASQDAYVARLTNSVATIMRAGLGDHLHCAYFRKFPKNPPSSPDFVKQLGPRYEALVPVVNQHVPAGAKLDDAHFCSYNGRKFLHVIYRGSNLVSLIIAEKRDGESFDIEGALPALAQSGFSVYRATAQKFQTAAFETKSHIVYLVSDLSGRENQERLLAMAPDVRGFLARLEEL